MKRYYYEDDPELPLSGTSIFLAGPTPRAPDVPSWRPEALQYLEALGFGGSVFVPERTPGLPSISSCGSTYEDMVNWELRHLNAASCILFWVPRDLATMPGFTTNVEFGCWVVRNPGKLVLGHPPWAVKMRYLALLARRYEVPTTNCLRDACRLAISTARGERRND